MRLTREQMRQRWLDRKAGKSKPEPDPVEQVEEAITELATPIQQRASDERRRRTEATSSRYWFAICFQTREQMEEFRIKVGLAHLGEDQYLDGLEVAEALDVEINEPTPQWKPNRPPSKKLVDLT